MEELPMYRTQLREMHRLLKNRGTSVHRKILNTLVRHIRLYTKMPRVTASRKALIRTPYSGKGSVP